VEHTTLVPHRRNEHKTINQIKRKLSDAKAIITKADKGNSTIIVYEIDYNTKIQDFIANNKFTQLTHDVTNKLQRNIRAAINECNDIIPRDKKWKYINLNPAAPNIRGLIKIHKLEAPIRPIVNWKNAPAYTLAKLLTKILQTYIPLPYSFNVKNTVQLIDDLTDIPYSQNLRLASFDISNMYTNIPTDELIKIIKTACQNNNIEDNLTRNIIKLSKTIIDQNYFQFLDKTYVQTEGLDMGAPTSSIFSELYLQFLENSTIYNLLLNHDIVGYFRYVDDILIVCDKRKTNIDTLLEGLNNISPKLKFTIEKEVEQKINFLDITINREPNKMAIDIYRKPTYTDVIIPNDSCHSREHKMAVHYLYNRMNTYHLSPRKWQEEKNIIQQILVHNGYRTTTLEDTSRGKKPKQEKNKNKTRWAKFTYTGNETRAITKAFKDTNLRIAYSTNNTIGKLLTARQQQPKCKYEKCGIYQITCPTCNMKYAGQTGSPFKIRFQEHSQDFKYGNRKSSFAQHLIDNRHAIGPMQDIMDIVHITKKGRMMDTLENFTYSGKQS
jgi:hypothetical protein